MFTSGTLALVAATAELGDSRLETPIRYDGPEVIARLDHKLVTEMLRAVGSDDEITIDVQNGETAVLIEVDGAQYRYVVMPLSRER